MTTILKMDYHKIKSFDKKAIEVLDRVEATEALGFEIIQQCQETIDLFYKECKEFEDIGSHLQTYFKSIAKDNGLILPQEISFTEDDDTIKNKCSAIPVGFEKTPGKKVSSFCGQTSFVSVESSHLKTPVSFSHNETNLNDDTCASDCLLATPVTIFISDKDLQEIETPSSITKNIFDPTVNSTELSTQYPLNTSYSSFKESESSGIYSSEEEFSSVTNITSAKTNSKLNDTGKSIASPLVCYENTLLDSMTNKTPVKGVVNYDNTANKLSDQSELNQTTSAFKLSPGKLVPYDKSVTLMSNFKTPSLVPYDKTSVTISQGDITTYDETLPSFSETFKNKTPSIVPYDKTSATIIQDSTTQNIVGYDTTIHLVNQSELIKSSLVPYETTIPHKTPVSENKTMTIINKKDLKHELSFDDEPSPIVSKELCNKTSYTNDGSTFDEMSAFENPNATGLMVGNIKHAFERHMDAEMNFCNPNQTGLSSLPKRKFMLAKKGKLFTDDAKNTNENVDTQTDLSTSRDIDFDIKEKETTKPTYEETTHSTVSKVIEIEGDILPVIPKLSSSNPRIIDIETDLSTNGNFDLMDTETTKPDVEVKDSMFVEATHSAVSKVIEIVGKVLPVIPKLSSSNPRIIEVEADKSIFSTSSLPKPSFNEDFVEQDSPEDLESAKNIHVTVNPDPEIEVFMSPTTRRVSVSKHQRFSNSEGGLVVRDSLHDDDGESQPSCDITVNPDVLQEVTQSPFVKKKKIAAAKPPKKRKRKRIPMNMPKNSAKVRFIDCNYKFEMYSKARAYKNSPANLALRKFSNLSHAVILSSAKRKVNRQRKRSNAKETPLSRSRTGSLKRSFGNASGSEVAKRLEMTTDCDVVGNETEQSVCTNCSTNVDVTQSPVTPIEKILCPKCVCALNQHNKTHMLGNKTSTRINDSPHRGNNRSRIIRQRKKPLAVSKLVKESLKISKTSEPEQSRQSSSSSSTESESTTKQQSSSSKGTKGKKAAVERKGSISAPKPNAKTKVLKSAEEKKTDPVKPVSGRSKQHVSIGSVTLQNTSSGEDGSSSTGVTRRSLRQRKAVDYNLSRSRTQSLAPQIAMTQTNVEKNKKEEGKGSKNGQLSVVDEVNEIQDTSTVDIVSSKKKSANATTNKSQQRKRKTTTQPHTLKSVKRAVTATQSAKQKPQELMLMEPVKTVTTTTTRTLRKRKVPEKDVSSSQAPPSPNKQSRISTSSKKGSTTSKGSSSSSATQRNESSKAPSTSSSAIQRKTSTKTKVLKSAEEKKTDPVKAVSGKQHVSIGSVILQNTSSGEDGSSSTGVTRRSLTQRKTSTSTTSKESEESEDNEVVLNMPKGFEKFGKKKNITNKKDSGKENSNICSSQDESTASSANTTVIENSVVIHTPTYSKFQKPVLRTNRSKVNRESINEAISDAQSSKNNLPKPFVAKQQAPTKKSFEGAAVVPNDVSRIRGESTLSYMQRKKKVLFKSKTNRVKTPDSKVKVLNSTAMTSSHDDIRSISVVDDISRIGRRASDLSGVTMNSRYLSAHHDVAYGIPEGLSTFLKKNYGGKSKPKQSKTSKQR